ncbi:MAG: Crp/Fnr family transcriptional regulator [Dehalococcoidia bacterium]|nr:Crp/Fnr family transcriptional regulator [Dehalococcoidia bacterium]
MAMQVDFLKRSPYFSGLGPAALDAIAKITFEKKIDRGEIFLLEGESDEVLYFVASGAVKIFKTSAEGKEQILGIARPGDSFNDVAVFDGGPNLSAAQAMGPVVIYGIRKSNLEAIIRDYPQVSTNVTRVLANRVRYLVSLVEDLSFKHVIGRIAKILLQYAGSGTETGQRLTQQEMAAMAGTVREVVGRSLKVLEQEGAIRLDHHRIIIADREALKKLTEEPS